MILEIQRLLSIKGITTFIGYDIDTQEHYIDLNTQAKSHLHLYMDGNIKGRYGTDEIYLDIEAPDHLINDLCLEYVDSKWGRDFGNKEWENLCIAYKINTK